MHYLCGLSLILRIIINIIWFSSHHNRARQTEENFKEQGNNKMHIKIDELDHIQT